MTSTTGPSSTENQPGWGDDPFGAFNFMFKIGDLDVAHFTECSAPEITVDTVEYREAGSKYRSVHHIPTVTTFAPLVLRQGLTHSTELFDWFMATVNGDIRRLGVSITLLDSRGTSPVLQWNLYDSLPVGWRGATLRATAREVYIQEFSLRYEGIERIELSNA